MDELINDEIIYEIEKLLQDARTHVALEVNNTLLKTYMEIGKLIVDDINDHNGDKLYEKSLRILSKELTQKFGKGFSKSNVDNMINFYLTYGSVQTLSGQT